MVLDLYLTGILHDQFAVLDTEQGFLITGDAAEGHIHGAVHRTHHHFIGRTGCRVDAHLAHGRVRVDQGRDIVGRRVDSDAAVKRADLHLLYTGFAVDDLIGISRQSQIVPASADIHRNELADAALAAGQLAVSHGSDLGAACIQNVETVQVGSDHIPQRVVAAVRPHLLIDGIGDISDIAAGVVAAPAIGIVHVVIPAGVAASAGIQRDVTGLIREVRVIDIQLGGVVIHLRHRIADQSMSASAAAHITVGADHNGLSGGLDFLDSIHKTGQIIPVVIELILNQCTVLGDLHAFDKVAQIHRVLAAVTPDPQIMRDLRAGIELARGHTASGDSHHAGSRGHTEAVAAPGAAAVHIVAVSAVLFSEDHFVSAFGNRVTIVIIETVEAVGEAQTQAAPGHVVRRLLDSDRIRCALRVESGGRGDRHGDGRLAGLLGRHSTAGTYRSNSSIAGLKGLLAGGIGRYLVVIGLADDDRHGGLGKLQRRSTLDDLKGPGDRSGKVAAARDDNSRGPDIGIVLIREFVAGPLGQGLQPGCEPHLHDRILDPGMSGIILLNDTADRSAGNGFRRDLEGLGDRSAVLADTLDHHSGSTYIPVVCVSNSVVGILFQRRAAQLHDKVRLDARHAGECFGDDTGNSGSGDRLRRLEDLKGPGNCSLKVACTFDIDGSSSDLDVVLIGKRIVGTLLQRDGSGADGQLHSRSLDTGFSGIVLIHDTGDCCLRDRSGLDGKLTDTGPDVISLTGDDDLRGTGFDVVRIRDRIVHTLRQGLAVINNTVDNGL